MTCVNCKRELKKCPKPSNCMFGGLVSTENNSHICKSGGKHEPEPTEAAPRSHCGCLEDQPHMTSCPTIFGDKPEREAVVEGQPPDYPLAEVPLDKWGHEPLPQPDTPRPSEVAKVVEHFAAASGTESAPESLIEAVNKAYADVVGEKLPYIKRQMDHSVNTAAYELWCVIARLKRIADAQPSSLTQAGPVCPTCGKGLCVIVDTDPHDYQSYVPAITCQDGSCNYKVHPGWDAKEWFKYFGAAQSQKGGRE